MGHIFIDFSRADKYGDRDQGLDISTSLGLRVAAHFFFGVGLDLLLSAVKDVEWRKQFTFENVCSLISKRYAMPTNKQLLLTIQFDEFSEVPKPVLNEIISLLGTHVTSKHDLCLCILAQLTGTDTNNGTPSHQ